MAANASSAPASPIPLPPTADARVLADERRRSIYLHVCRASHPVTTNDVAEAFATHRNAAKHHLDRLLDAGLLKAEFHRVNGKRGPGAGRPSKLYSPTNSEVSFHLPERHYDLLAHLLLQTVVEGNDLEAVGQRYGRELAEALQPEGTRGTSKCVPTAEEAANGVAQVLDRLGFSPKVEVDGSGHMWITTENCPFGWVASQASEGEVCRLDRAIIAGVLEGFGCPGSEVRGVKSLASGNDVCVREAIPPVSVGSHGCS